MTCNDCKHSYCCCLLRHKSDLNTCEDFKYEEFEEDLSAEWVDFEDNGDDEKENEIKMGNDKRCC